MSSTISPNMGLIVPGVGTEPGPAWATELNSDLGILDQHDHSAGRGVPVTPNGLDIISDLSIGSNNLTFVKTVNFAAQLTPLAGVAPNLGAVYVAGNELYYNDEVGNVVQITNAGVVNSGAGSISGLPSGTASAAYSAGPGTFIWQSSTSTAANMDNASVTIREQVALANGVTLKSPNSLAASYDLIFPSALPGSTKILTVDTAGNIGDVYDVDNTTIEVASNLLRVKAGGITTTQISATAGILGTQIAAATIAGSNIAADTVSVANLVQMPNGSTVGVDGIAFNGPSGTFSTTSLTYVSVTNLSITITTTGRPVYLSLLAIQTAPNEGRVNIPATGGMYFRFFRDAATDVGSWFLTGTTRTDSACFNTIDNDYITGPGLPAGTYTYEFQIHSGDGSSVSVENLSLTAYEI